jgi:tRNA 2-selenouridine synthase
LKSFSATELLKQIEGNSLIDVRSSAEYKTGHIPDAVNIPLFNNEERAEVGTLYKQVGSKEAMFRGLDIVGPKLSTLVKEASALSYKDNLLVHCWRGGMRSSSFAWLMNTSGIPTLTLAGGYKAFRRYAHEFLSKPWRFKVITACTGSGKTELLWHLRKMGQQVVDLEDLANHKGSVFGGLGHGEQPSTEQFENNLFWAMKDFDINLTVWIEDESVCIGHVFIPQSFYNRMHFSPLYKIDVSLNQRINRLVNEYSTFDMSELSVAISKIAKRLGYDNAKKAQEELAKNNFVEVTRILLHYYDKAYNKSIEERRDIISFEKIYDDFNPKIIAEQIV